MPRKEFNIGGTGRVMDARPDRLDLRDRPYRPHLTNLHIPPEWPDDRVLGRWLSAYTSCGLILDQGQDGACTGFGLAAVVNFLHFKSDIEAGTKVSKQHPSRQVSQAMLYELAKLYDEWPGEDYDGSSCRGALKGWHRHGVCRSALWPCLFDDEGERVDAPPKENLKDPNDAETNWDVDALATTLGAYYRIDVRSVVDMQSAIRETGAIYVSCAVHDGWGVKRSGPVKGHADLPTIPYTERPTNLGGHAFALVGYNDLGFVVQNSWGTSWGAGGFALLPYEEWTRHGSDAWVFTLGLSRQRSVLQSHRVKSGKRHASVAPAVIRSPRHFISAADQGEPSESRAIGLVGAEDSDGLDRRFAGLPEKYRPLSTDAAYQHTVVLDRGYLTKNDIAAKDPKEALKRVGRDLPLKWLKERGSKKVVIFAHGGLNKEAASINRVRVMSPYFLESDIYPLYVTWRSGAMETISDIVEENAARLGLGGRGPAGAGVLQWITDKTDKLLEPVLRPLGSALWSQMKLNATRASGAEAGGVRQLVGELAQLDAAAGGIEIHLMGHSAGSIVLGAMMEPLTNAGLKVASLRLYAPACTIEFALQTYARAIKAGTLSANKWTTHYLSESNEQDDSVGPYRKSLLYLVSRACEDQHKTPLLGMQTAFEHDVKNPKKKDDLWAGDANAQLGEWASFRAGAGKGLTSVPLTARSVSNGKKGLKSSHGCFDNAVEVVGPTIDAIRGKVGKWDEMRLDY